MGIMEMFEDVNYTIVIVIWLIVTAMIWKMMLPSQQNMFGYKMLATILMLPIIAIIVGNASK